MEIGFGESTYLLLSYFSDSNINLLFLCLLGIVKSNVSFPVLLIGNHRNRLRFYQRIHLRVWTRFPVPITIITTTTTMTLVVLKVQVVVVTKKVVVVVKWARNPAWIRPVAVLADRGNTRLTPMVTCYTFVSNMKLISTFPDLSFSFFSLILHFYFTLVNFI